MNDRIKLAEARGWKRGEVHTVAVMGTPVSAQRWIDPEGNDRAPSALPSPFEDANDDYAVLEWLRAEGAKGKSPFVKFGRHRWQSVCDAMIRSRFGYQIGDYARAALKVIK